MRAAAAIVVVLLAGCGGGAVSPNSLQPPAASGPRSTLGTATLTLVVPRGTSAGQRAPRYVSPNSSYLVVTVVSVDGQPPTAAQVPAAVNSQKLPLATTPGGNCAAGPGGTTCTVTVPAPAGQVTYRFDLFDASNNKLATLTQTYAIAPGTTSNLQAVLRGIAVSVVISVPSIRFGTAFSGPLGVAAYDASGALIVGSAPYASSFTLTESDTSGHTSLTVNATTGVTAVVTGPNDVVIFNFDGQRNASFTITASGGSLPPGGGGSATVPAT
ncbi:MAG: hypothetical protein NVS3B7_19130 [Candidatus Elarobacter sp.]